MLSLVDAPEVEPPSGESLVVDEAALANFEAQLRWANQYLEQSSECQNLTDTT